MEKAIDVSMTLGRGREGEFCDMKLVEKVNVEAKSMRAHI